MELRTHGLELHLRPIGQADSGGWTRVHAEVRVSGFLGQYNAQIQLEDLERFALELRDMHDGFDRDSRAVLRSAEPDLFIELAMNRLGQIKGRYVFESERRDGVPTALTGAFEMDQSFLPLLRQRCDELIAQLSPGKRPG
jgi:hypothetical protein